MTLQELSNYPNNASVCLTDNESTALAEDVRRTLSAAGLPVDNMPEQYASITFQGKTFHLTARE